MVRRYRRLDVGRRDIAERAVGDGSRSSEILHLNPHIRYARALRAREDLRLPGTATVPDDRKPVAGLPADETDGFLPATTIVIERGDNLWNLSEDRLELALGRKPKDRDVLGYSHEVIDANPDVVEDPNLIFLGEEFDFPAIGEPPSPLPEPATAELSPPVVAHDPAPDLEPRPTRAPVPAQPGPLQIEVVDTTTPPSPSTTTAPTLTLPAIPTSHAAPRATSTSTTSATPWWAAASGTVLASGVLVALRRKQRLGRRSSARPADDADAAPLESQLARAPDVPLVRRANPRDRRTVQEARSSPVQISPSRRRSLRRTRHRDPLGPRRALYDEDVRLPALPHRRPSQRSLRSESATATS